MKFLTALGAQAHFVKMTKIDKKNVNGVWATARFRKNFEPRVGHSNISTLEKKVEGEHFVVGRSSADLRTATKPKVKKPLDVRQNLLVPLTALQPQHFFDSAIFSWRFMIILTSGVLSESESIGYSWSNAHFSKSTKSENVKSEENEKK